MCLERRNQVRNIKMGNKWWGNRCAEKNPRVLVDTKLRMNQQGDNMPCLHQNKLIISSGGNVMKSIVIPEPLSTNHTHSSRLPISTQCTQQFTFNYFISWIKSFLNVSFFYFFFFSNVWIVPYCILQQVKKPIQVNCNTAYCLVLFFCTIIIIHTTS